MSAKTLCRDNFFDVCAVCDIPTTLRLISVCKGFAIPMVEVVNPVDLMLAAIAANQTEIVWSIAVKFTADVSHLSYEILKAVAECRDEIIDGIIQIFNHVLTISDVLNIAVNELCPYIVNSYIVCNGEDFQNGEFIEHMVWLIDQYELGVAEDIYNFLLNNAEYSIDMTDVLTNIDHEQIHQLEEWGIPELEDFFIENSQPIL